MEAVEAYEDALLMPGWKDIKPPRGDELTETGEYVHGSVAMHNAGCPCSLCEDVYEDVMADW